MGIRSIHSDTDGTKIAFIDDHNQGYIYCPSDEDAVMIPNFPKNCTKILWDSMPSRTFVVFESKLCTTYVYSKYSISSKLSIVYTFQLDAQKCVLCKGKKKYLKC